MNSFTTVTLFIITPLLPICSSIQVLHTTILILIRHISAPAGSVRALCHKFRFKVINFFRTQTDFNTTTKYLKSSNNRNLIMYFMLLLMWHQMLFNKLAQRKVSAKKICRKIGKLTLDIQYFQNLNYKNVWLIFLNNVIVD